MTRGNDRKITALIISGVIILLISIIIIVAGVIVSTGDEKVGTNGDFDRNQDGSYRLRVASDSTMEYIRIEIRSRVGYPVDVDVSVTDSFDRVLFSQRVTTPEDIQVDVSPTEDGYWYVTLKFAERMEDIGDIEVTVYTDEINDLGLCLCCSGPFMTVVSVIMIIAGSVISRKKKDGEKIGRLPSGPTGYGTRKIRKGAQPFRKEPDAKKRRMQPDKHTLELSIPPDKDTPKPRKLSPPPGFEDDI